MHIGAARWVLSYERLCLSNFEQTQSLPRSTMGLIPNHSKALGPFLFRRSGPLFDSPVPVSQSGRSASLSSRKYPAFWPTRGEATLCGECAGVLA
jgi:hypothetical protein